MQTNNNYEIIRINNDVNGNPRYVVHFMAFILDIDNSLSIPEQYNIALSRTKKYGGKKYHNKQYGGGIAFTFYSPEIEINKIIDILIGKKNNAN